MQRVTAKMVPCVLTMDQKRAHMEACQELKEQLEIDPEMFSKVITGDETKQQSSQWKHPGSPRPKKARPVLSSLKMMLICLFDVKVIILKGSLRFPWQKLILRLNMAQCWG